MKKFLTIPLAILIIASCKNTNTEISNMFDNKEIDNKCKQGLEPQVANFIKFVKDGDKKAIADLVEYPLFRKYPIPSIKNRQEFIERYDEIFDQALKNAILNFYVCFGARGFFFISDIKDDAKYFQFTPCYDEGCDIRLQSIEYESEFEKKLRNQLIESERKTLHPSIRNFKDPICILETSEFRIRVDCMESYENEGYGSCCYRYASWSINKPMSEKPDLIITGGKVYYEGSGGSHRYIFKNGDFLYECSFPPEAVADYEGNIGFRIYKGWKANEIERYAPFGSEYVILEQPARRIVK